MTQKKEPTRPGSAPNNIPKVAKSIRYCKSEAVKMLERLATDEAIRLHPNTPQHYIAPRTYRDDTANSLSKCVNDFLRLKGNFCERTGNEGRVIDQRKAVTDVLGNVRMIGSIQRVHGSGMRGTSDLKAVINGRFVAIEVKCAATNDRLSDAQKLYQQSVEAAGGIYITAATFAGFYELYNQTFSDGSR
jgi:hypothetical protein